MGRRRGRKPILGQQHLRILKAQKEPAMQRRDGEQGGDISRWGQRYSMSPGPGGGRSGKEEIRAKGWVWEALPPERVLEDVKMDQSIIMTHKISDSKVKCQAEMQFFRGQ